MNNRLATEIRRLRGIRGYSLREVEKATGVSNAYLSQLERGDATKPSPEKLSRLAKFYEVPYERLMELAGYLTPSIVGIADKASNMELIGSGRAKARVGVLRDALLSTDLSEDELNMVADYVAFIKTRRKKQGRR